MEHRFVYMDYNATTPLRDEVKARMIEDFEVFANASSMHEAGRRARDRVEKARGQVAALIGARDPLSVIFTSGGSESNNTVFNTMYDLGRKARPYPRKKIITTAIEHPCVLNSARRLAPLSPIFNVCSATLLNPHVATFERRLRRSRRRDRLALG